jgi:DNA-binding MarR family transcriptional regulator
MPSKRQHSPYEIASAFGKASVRLRYRFLSESGSAGKSPWTWTQIVPLIRLVNEGPMTATRLADLEHVRRQSMAETIASLRANGLVESEQDPTDGRKTILRPTDAGRAIATRVPAGRLTWLTEAIGELLNSEEQLILLHAAALMERLADHNMPAAQS